MEIKGKTNNSCNVPNILQPKPKSAIRNSSRNGVRRRSEGFPHKTNKVHFHTKINEPTDAGKGSDKLKYTKNNIRTNLIPFLKYFLNKLLRTIRKDISKNLKY